MRLAVLPLMLVFSLLAALFLAGCDQPPKRLSIGDPAPDFSAVDIQGRPVRLADWRGRPVIIRFFYPDCRYCRADTKVFNDFYQRFHGQGLEILYINTKPQSADLLGDFAAELNIKFPIVVDTDGSLARRYFVQVVPQAIILSPEHRIASAIMGGVSGEELEELLGKYFQKS